MSPAHQRQDDDRRGPGARLASRFNRAMERVYDRLRHPAAWTVAVGDDGAAGGHRPAGVEGLRGSTYAVLVTYRRSGEPVPSPVWFAVDDGVVLVRTFAGSGKVRRIRHDPRALIAPSTLRGRPTGPAVRVEARLLPPDAWPRAEEVLAQAYGLGRRLYEGAAGEQGDALAYLELRPVDGSAPAPPRSAPSS